METRDRKDITYFISLLAPVIVYLSLLGGINVNVLPLLNKALGLVLAMLFVIGLTKGMKMPGEIWLYLAFVVWAVLSGLAVADALHAITFVVGRQHRAIRRRQLPETALEARGLALDCGLLRDQLAAGILERRSGQVSGGELQRLAIVRAMLLEPMLVFADEATSRLDMVTQERTMDCLLSELTASECALLLVTHDRELAGAADDVHVRRPLANQFLVFLGHTAEHADDGVRSASLAIAQGTQSAVDLVLRVLANTAGVEQDGVGVVDIVG